MNKEYFEEQLKISVDLENKSRQKKISFYQNLLLVASSTVGILISLHSTNLQYQYIQLVFVLSIILLSLGVFFLSILIYDLSDFESRLRKAFVQEVQEAARQDRLVETVYLDYRKRTSIFEICSYICLITGFTLLIFYSSANTLQTKNTETKIIKKEIKIIHTQAPNR